jgi:CheY-like chemotaxis protein
MITILAVDDNPNDLFLIRRALRPSEFPCELITAENGIEAQKRLLKLADTGGENPLVVFSDVDMPQQGGFAFLEWLKREPGLNQIPVVMISSFENQANVERAFELGALACMTKPPNPKAVHGLLKTISNMAPAPVAQ